MVLSERDGLVTAFVVLGLIFWSCLEKKFLGKNHMRKYKNNPTIYRKIKKTRSEPPIPKKVHPGPPWALTNHLWSFGAGGSWSIWGLPGGTPKSPKLVKIAKNAVSKFDDFSGCLPEALPEGFGSPKCPPKHEN